MQNHPFSRRALAVCGILLLFGFLMVRTDMGLQYVFALPPEITVNSNLDTTTSGDGACTLREAIANANADGDISGGDCAPGSGDDTIRFSPALIGQTITLSGTELFINSNVTIAGPGASQLAISGNNASRVFYIAGGTVTISGITIRDGRISAADGAGIANAGTLTLDGVTVSANSIVPGDITQGGGIFNTGTLTVTHSAVFGNAAARGGGIANVSSGAATIINTTVSTNTAETFGGGLVNADSGVMTLNHVTVVNNAALNFNGGGLEVEGNVTLQNSIIANNTDKSGANDCNYLFTQPVSQGYNLVAATGNCTTFTVAGDVTGVNPQLGGLTDNGGETQSYMPLTGSAAIDAIPVGVNGCNPAAGATDDQRGYLRVGACTIGAVEYDGIWLTMTQTVNDPTPDPAQTITYTVVVNLAPSGNVSVTDGMVLDTLPAGINFVGSITSFHGRFGQYRARRDFVEPIAVTGASGSAGTPLTLGMGITLSGGETIAFKFPVTVSIGVTGGTTIENTASMTTTEVVAPVVASTVLTVNNVAPVAMDDMPVVLEDSANTFTVRDNDFDLNGDMLTLPVVGAPDNGGSAVKNGETIDYAPAANFNGTEVFSYTLSDGVLSDTATVTVTVTPVNDAPSFTKGSDQWLLQTAGAQTFSGWATGMSAGPADESGQVLAFNTTTDHPALFAAQPAIDAASGDLTFTPVTTMSGTAIVTVTLSDDGGTANGGADTSAPQTFTITIVPGDVSGAIDPSAGGSLVYGDGTVTATVTAPGGAVGAPTTLVFDEITASAHPASPGFAFAGRFFTLSAYQNQVLQSNFTFSTPITLTLDYTADGVQFADENSLEVRYWDGSAWRTDGIALISRDTVNRRVTVTLSHLTEFALMGLSPILNIDTTVAGSVSPVAGGTLTYTLVLSNSGALTAHGVTMSDTLPSGVSFGGWVQQGAAMVAGDTVSWGAGDVVSFTAVTVAFTATITDGTQFADSVITNTARFTSTDAGSGASAATVAVGSISRVYLPLILK